MAGESGLLGVRFEAVPGVDAVEVEQLALGLRAELVDLDVESVEFARAGPAPEGTRSGEAFDVAMLVINVAKSGAAARTSTTELTTQPSSS